MCCVWPPAAVACARAPRPQTLLVINPDHKYKLGWNLAVAFLAIFTIIAIPLQARPEADPTHTTWTWAWTRTGIPLSRAHMPTAH